MYIIPFVDNERTSNEKTVLNKFNVIYSVGSHDVMAAILDELSMRMDRDEDINWVSRVVLVVLER